jgi:hypothetical protein
MTERMRMALAAMGPVLTILVIVAGEQKPLDDHIQLMSVSFGVSAVVLAIGYVVQHVRGKGLRSVGLTTAIGVALVLLALLVSASFSAEVRAWLPILVVTAPVITFPSVFGAALATCAGAREAKNTPA